jgi:tRNA pseudouridine55 synthase
VLLDKEPGSTSFQTLFGLKRKLGTRHIGHAGTLDRFAEGLLIVLVGRCTRLASLLQGLSKEYLAQIRFGIETDTLDPEGKAVGEAPVPLPETIHAALPALTGVIRQVPPAYSAVHVQGSRASRLARRGMNPSLAPRTVTVHRIDLVAYDPPVLTIRVSCSKGTYIRSLARDLALLCGSRAYVSSLRRMAIGPFRAEEAVKERDFQRSRDLLPSSILRRIGDAWPQLTAKEPYVSSIQMGVPFRDEFISASAVAYGSYGLFAPDGELLALLEKGADGYRYSAVLAGGCAERPRGCAERPRGPA